MATPTPRQPSTMPHSFTLSPLREHFTKTPNPPASNRLIDLPPTEFLETEEEIAVFAAALWILAVRWDKMDEKERPGNKDDLRKWIAINRLPVLKDLTNKIEPPFHPWSIDQLLKDIMGMMEELLLQTIPVQPEEKKGKPSTGEGGSAAPEVKK